MRGMITWFARNHVAANLLMFFLVIAGIVTAFTTKVEVFPESSPDLITITTEYPGASPDDVEEGILRRIEEGVAGLAGIERIDSVAREGVGTITIEVIQGWNIKKLLDEVKSEVARITTLPKEAEEPIIREVTHRTQVVDVVVYGDASEWTLKHLAEQIKDDITNLPGITLADLFGVRTGEIHIEVDEHTLRRYGLTLAQVADRVRQGSLDLPAGRIKAREGEVLIRTKGRRYRAADYRDIAVVTRPDGTTVTLGQIATLKDGFEDTDLFARFQGKPAAIIQVFRVADQNALHVADVVKTYIERTRRNLPEGVHIDYYRDRSTVLKNRIRLLLKNMAIGLVLVSILLTAFLSVRLAFWVTLGIPVSFLCGIWLLPYFDVSINMISLFAFIMVLGIVVDDAIVIGENIFRKREQGLNKEEASIEGAIQVGIPVIFSVLTTVAAFWPLMLGTGVIGKVMRNIPIVVILVLLGSLIEALFILPAHLARSKGERKTSGNVRRKDKWTARWLKAIVDGPYSRFVDLCLRWRYATVAFGVATLLLILGLWFGGKVKFTFFPSVESNELVCSITMPSGTPVARTSAIVSRIEQAAREVLSEADAKRPKDAPPLLKYLVSLIGVQLPGPGSTTLVTVKDSNRAQITVQLIGVQEREVSAASLASAWRERVGAIPDAESLTFESELFSTGNPIEVHLSLDNHQELLRAAEELKEELRTIPGVFDVSDSFLPGKDEIRLKLKPRARSLGLTLNDLAQQVRHAFYGAEALRLQRDEDEVKVLVRYPENERRSLKTIRDMRIRTRDGLEVPFSEVAEVTEAQGYASIQRAQRRRVVKVTADVDETLANANEIRTDLTGHFLPQLQNRYPGLRFSIEGEGKEQTESLEDVLRGFILALFCIYTLLAIPFKSFTQPFVVMTAIPFGIVGAVIGHMIMGLNLSILSMFGIVGLAGVVVNDSLVLIDAANRLRDEGASVHDAAARAGALRFRAIILTSVTTFAGLTPMIMEKSLQAQFLIPMAVSLGFGVMFATLITLIIVPCGYLILEDIHDFIGYVRKLHSPKPADKGNIHYLD